MLFPVGPECIEVLSIAYIPPIECLFSEFRYWMDAQLSRLHD